MTPMKTAAVDSSGYEKGLLRLNKAQKEAVETIDGPVMVIAGPGTGKTEILALRIANILQKTDANAANILALTFTDAGAHNMRERLTRYIGADAYHVAIHTFHSFAGEQIGRYGDAYPAIIGGRAVNDLERIKIIEDIINDGNFDLLRPHGDPLFYVREIPRAISELKKENISPDVFASRIALEEEQLQNTPKLHEKGAHKGKVRRDFLELEKRINKHRELLLVYRLYQSTLRDKRLYDFEDMIVETVKALENNEDMLRDLQETYQYILADEHQDANQSQNRILELLAEFHERPNLFVVGDEKQAIFRFQGASLDNFLYFQDKFSGTKVISLTDNYRSTTKILSLAHELIKTDDEILRDLRIPLNSSNDALSGAKTRVELRRFSHEALEDEWVMEEVKNALDDGIAPEEIAVITRYNKDVVHFTKRLRQAGVEVSTGADMDILEHPITRSVETLIRAAGGVGDETALFDCLTGGWWKINASDIAKVLAAQSGTWPLSRIIEDEEKLQELEINEPSAIIRVATILKETRERSVTEAPHELLHYLIKESGLLDIVMEKDPIEGAAVLRRIYDEIETAVIEDRATSLKDLASQFSYRRLHNLPIHAPFITRSTGAVLVMTAHKSKGLEFETVILPRVTDKCFGKGSVRDLFKLPLTRNQLITDLKDSEDDERRLLYVAMTRAKKNLLIGLGAMNGEGRPLEQSRFLTAISEDFIDSIDTAHLEADFKPESIFTNSPATLKLSPEIIRALFLSRGFSVTHLNNYLEDPQKYLLENLLRRPQPRTLSLMFGTAVHEVLEKAVKYLNSESRSPKDSEVSEWLKLALSRLPLSTKDETSLHKRAFTALLSYISHLNQELLKNSRSEVSIKVTLETGDSDLPEIPLSGKLDRVDYDAEGKVIRVVDYKTGKPKSRNDVAGETKSSDGKYKRQLVFYGLLLSLYNPEEKLPEEFLISFVEPKENGLPAQAGETVEHTFAVTKDEVEELKKEVVRVAKEIVLGQGFGM